MRISSPAIVLAIAVASAGVAPAQDDAGVVPVDASAANEVPSATIIAINIDGANVSINGIGVGQSPLAPQALERGDVIEVRKAEFAPLRYEHDGSESVALYLKRLEPLDIPAETSGDFPWLWVGLGAGAVAAAVAVIIVAASAGGSSESGIPIPRIE